MKTRILLLLAVAVTASACGPRFHAMTTPPPGRSAQLTEKTKFWGGWKYKVHLTEGTVLAVGCNCSRLGVTTDDARVAAVMKAHATNTDPITQRETRVASFVIVGVKPGKTYVRIKGSNGSRVIPVMVERSYQPPPMLNHAGGRQL